MGYIPKVLVVGEPVDAKTLYYSNYLVKYNNNKKIPHYVLEYITKDKLNGDADRRNCSFMPDPNIPYKFKSTNEDYMYSDYCFGRSLCQFFFPQSNKDVIQTKSNTLLY